MNIKIVGHDSMGWSIDEDRRNIEHLLTGMSDVQLASSALRADSIFLVWYSLLTKYTYSYLKILKKISHKKIISVATNNLSDNQETFLKVNPYIDMWIAPSKLNQTFLNQHQAKNILLPFYVDPEVFRAKKIFRKNYLPEKFHNKFIISSFQRDTEGRDLTTPKWQKDPKLILDVARQLDPDKFAFLLAGPRRHYLVQEFRKHKIPYCFYGEEKYIDENKDDVNVNNISKTQISNLYCISNLYLVTSKSEGGPKAVLEASLSKTPIVSTKVGLAPDFLANDCIIPPDPKKIAQLIVNFEKKSYPQQYITKHYQKVSQLMTPAYYQAAYHKLFKML